MLRYSTPKPTTGTVVERWDARYGQGFTSAVLSLVHGIPTRMSSAEERELSDLNELMHARRPYDERRHARLNELSRRYNANATAHRAITGALTTDDPRALKAALLQLPDGKGRDLAGRL